MSNHPPFKVAPGVSENIVIADLPGWNLVEGLNKIACPAPITTVEAMVCVVAPYPRASQTPPDEIARRHAFIWTSAVPPGNLVTGVCAIVSVPKNSIAPIMIPIGCFIEHTPHGDDKEAARNSLEPTYALPYADAAF